MGSQAAYFKFDEGYSNTAYDSGPSRLSGTLSGQQGLPQWKNEGKFGKSLYFYGDPDGNGSQTGSYVDISSTAALHPTEQVTVSAWVKKTIGATGAVVRTAGDYYLDFTGATTLRFGVNNNWGDSNSGYPDDGNWHYIVGKYDGVYTYRYVDGKLLGVTSRTGAITNSGENVHIGTRNDLYSEYFTGYIDEVKIYDYAFNDDDIKIDMNHGSSLMVGSTPVAEDLYGDWVYFEDPARADVLDASTHSVLLKSSNWCGEFPATINRTGKYQLSFEYSGTGTLYVDNDGINDNIWNTNMLASNDWQTYAATSTFTTTGSHLLYFRTSGSNINIRYVKIKELSTSNYSATQFYCLQGDRSKCEAPVGEWNFDEMSGGSANDTSGSNNLGTLQSSPSWITAGKNNSALNFNGSGKRVTLATPFGQAGYTTVSLWYKRSESDSSGSWRTLVGDASANVHHLISQLGSRNLGIWDGSFRDFGYNPPDDGRWHQYEVIYNSGVNATLYVDGLYKSQIATTLNLQTNPIGSIGNWNGGDYWIGQLDEVKIYNYARTAAQIAKDYNGGKPVGWWRMDDCQGVQLNDSSGNGNTGTLTIGSSGGGQTTPGTCTSPTDGTGSWYDGASGKLNASLNLDGNDDYADMGDPASGIYDFDTGPFTVLLWGKATYKSSSFISKKLAGGIWNTNAGWALTYVSSPTTLYVVVDDGSTHREYNTGLGTISSWKYLGLMRDSAGKIYFINDGKIIDTTYTVTGSVSNASNLQVTKNYGYLNGQVDDVRVYNYALTADQIKQAMNDGAVRYGP